MRINKKWLEEYKYNIINYLNWSFQFISNFQYFDGQTPLNIYANYNANGPSSTFATLAAMLRLQNGCGKSLLVAHIMQMNLCRNGLRLEMREGLEGEGGGWGERRGEETGGGGERRRLEGGRRREIEGVGTWDGITWNLRRNYKRIHKKS